MSQGFSTGLTWAVFTELFGYRPWVGLVAFGALSISWRSYNGDKLKAECSCALRSTNKGSEQTKNNQPRHIRTAREDSRTGDSRQGSKMDGILQPPYDQPPPALLLRQSSKQTKVPSSHAHCNGKDGRNIPSVCYNNSDCGICECYIRAR